MSDTKTKRIQMPDEMKEWLKKIENIPDPIDIRGRKYYPKEYAGCGYKGVVWKGKDEFDSEIAIKFTIAEDYKDRSYLQEFALASKLRGYERFSTYIDVDVVDIEIPSYGTIKFVCFIEEWIDGPTLEEFLQDKNKVTGTFLREFVRMMAEALSQMKALGLCHDDLRPSNIKIAPPKLGSIYEYETEVKIIDLGSLKRAPSKKKKDDHKWFVEHIVNIRNAIHDRKILSVREKRFIKEIDGLIERMLDPDPTVALTDPKKIIDQFESAWNKSISMEEDGEKFDNPFYYIYAESMNDKLLVDLFAESCPWKNEIIGPDPLLVTGPRGCGKSTLFRRLSLKGLLFKKPDEIKNSPIAGFYLSCGTDLRNRINWIKNENLARRYKEYIIHYFNLLLTKSVVETLNLISLREDREELFGLGKKEEKEIHEFILKKLGIPHRERQHLQGVSPITHVLEIIEREIENCYEALIQGRQLQRTTPISYISDLTNFLSNKIRYFKSRKIVFLIDDLSTRIIPEPVQHILNDIILLERSPNHVFKIAADKNGWVGIDTLSKGGDFMREFKEVDVGRYYLTEVSRKEKIKFTVETLQKRLEAAGYLGTPEEILGKSNYKEGSLIKEIRMRKIKKEKINNVYYGIETISELCAGDVAILLEIVRRIFEKGRVDKHTRTMVPANIQHKAIVSVSRSFYTQIRSYFPYGEEMYTIVTSFGTLMRKILHEGKYQEVGGKYIPNSVPRIEVDEDPSQSYIEMSDKLREIMNELIKRAIFIELQPSTARHTYKPSLRWHIRPILCPTFEVAPTKNVAIKWRTEEFKEFLASPIDKCEREFNTRWKMSEKYRERIEKGVWRSIFSYEKNKNNNGLKNGGD